MEDQQRPRNALHVGCFRGFAFFTSWANNERPAIKADGE